MIRVRGFEGRRVAIFGLGRSGMPAARSLAAGGAQPVLWDDDPASREAAATEGFVVEDLRAADWSEINALVLAPGAPLTHPEPHWTVSAAAAAGVPVIGDMELYALALSHLAGGERPRTIAITGTNGKSTTTALIGWMLSQAGRDVRIGGNIGVGVLALPEVAAAAVYVLEVSSYQLDLTRTFRPDVAVLLNISPDHLDRHGTMERYVEAKRRIFANQGAGDTAVIGVDDPWSRAVLETVASTGTQSVEAVSVHQRVDSGVFADGAQLFRGGAGSVERICDLTRARTLRGRHNAQNAAAAYLAVTALGVSSDVAVEALMSFPGLAHRMEPVAHVGDVEFVNDSKATNAEAARQAMSSYPRFRWIAGGRPKSGGIQALQDLFPRIERAYLIGEAAGEFAACLDGHAPWVISGDIRYAVQQAFEDAEASREKEVVLLSPACASFDQFPDFEARGEAFRAAVKALKHP